VDGSDLRSCPMDGFDISVVESLDLAITVYDKSAYQAYFPSYSA
jgi:hypothetical protein